MIMITIKNNIIPFKGYKAMAIWPFIFVRKSSTYNEIDIRHEHIHGKQQVEMLIVFFYVWYLIEYIFRLIQYGKHSTAYKNISFEREAYANQRDLLYLDDRKLYSWTKYLSIN